MLITRLVGSRGGVYRGTCACRTGHRPKPQWTVLMNTMGDNGYTDRRDAGQVLAERLRRRDWHAPVVFGIARGGVPVAHEVAEELRAPLRVMVARKIGAPGRPEFGVGAVTAEGPPTYDGQSLWMLGLSPADLEPSRRVEQAEARRRVRAYQEDEEPGSLRGRDVIVVDDGLATGVTATAALRAAREREPARLVFAAPVCAPSAPGALLGEADDVVCPLRPSGFQAVGEWYGDFRQTTDEEVVRLLRETPQHR
jgi:putative phosphoribosyl transferase